MESGRDWIDSNFANDTLRRSKLVVVDRERKRRIFIFST